MLTICIEGRKIAGKVRTDQEAQVMTLMMICVFIFDKVPVTHAPAPSTGFPLMCVYLTGNAWVCECECGCECECELSVPFLLCPLYNSNKCRFVMKNNRKEGGKRKTHRIGMSSQAKTKFAVEWEKKYTRTFNEVEGGAGWGGVIPSKRTIRWRQIWSWAAQQLKSLQRPGPGCDVWLHTLASHLLKWSFMKFTWSEEAILLLYIYIIDSYWFDSPVTTSRTDPFPFTCSRSFLGFNLLNIHMYTPVSSTVRFLISMSTEELSAVILSLSLNVRAMVFFLDSMCLLTTLTSSFRSLNKTKLLTPFTEHWHWILTASSAFLHITPLWAECTQKKKQESNPARVQAINQWLPVLSICTAMNICVINVSWIF